jgi:hypothetical protein
MKIHAMVIEELPNEMMPGACGQPVLHWVGVIAAVYALTYRTPAY